MSKSCYMLAATASNPKPMTKTIHVRLLNEGTNVSRPTEGLEIVAGLYKLLPTVYYARQVLMSESRSKRPMMVTTSSPCGYRPDQESTL